MRKEFQATLVMIVFAFIGIILCALLGLMYSEGYISPFLLNGITLESVQFLVFMLCLIVGGVIGALKS